MKKSLFIIIFLIAFTAIAFDAAAQCSICTKTAMQLGTKPASGLNAGILYLMSIPYLAVGFIGYRWWRSKRGQQAEEVEG